MATKPSPEVSVPPMFSPGNTVSFVTPERTETLTFTIVHAFTPITKSVALRVRSQQLGTEDFVIKIYDPRFIDDRLLWHFQLPWTFATEELAATAYKRGEYNEEVRFGEEDGSEDAAMWEAWLRDNLLTSYEKECKAYHQLTELQGSAIPRFFFSGIVLPPDKRAIELPAIVIEYIPDAVSLRNLPANLLTVDLCISLLSTVDSLRGYGVIHNDLNYSNILFTPAEKPERSYIIDFGSAEFKDECEDPPEWPLLLFQNGDDRRVRDLLLAKNEDVWEMVPEKWHTPPSFSFTIPEGLGGSVDGTTRVEFAPSSIPGELVLRDEQPEDLEDGPAGTVDTLSSIPDKLVLQDASD